MPTVYAERSFLIPNTTHDLKHDYWYIPCEIWCPSSKGTGRGWVGTRLFLSLGYFVALEAWKAVLWIMSVSVLHEFLSIVKAMFLCCPSMQNEMGTSLTAMCCGIEGCLFWTGVLIVSLLTLYSLRQGIFLGLFKKCGKNILKHENYFLLIQPQGESLSWAVDQQVCKIEKILHLILCRS